MNYFSNFKHTRDGIMFLYLCMLDNGDGVRTSVRALSEELSISQPCVRGSLKRLISTSFVSKVRLNCGQGKGLLIKPMNTAVSGLFEMLEIKVRTMFNLIQTEKESQKEKNPPCIPLLKEKEKEKEKATANVRARAKADLQQALELRKSKFWNELLGFADRYEPSLLHEFFDYWSEPTRSMHKMRMELSPTWNTARRLATWYQKSLQYGKSQTPISRRPASKHEATTQERRERDFIEIGQHLAASATPGPGADTDAADSLALLPWED